MNTDYDIFVVGAGHAGCEAAAAAANLGSSVLLITMNLMNIAQMSCNPAMGGIAKGQIVREIDALGGYSGIVTDRTMIQFRMLNRSKGPAMWSPRAQSERVQFSLEWRKTLEDIPNIDFRQDAVVSIIISQDLNKIPGYGLNPGSQDPFYFFFGGRGQQQYPSAPTTPNIQQVGAGSAHEMFIGYGVIHPAGHDRRYGWSQRGTEGVIGPGCVIGIVGKQGLPVIEISKKVH